MRVCSGMLEHRRKYIYGCSKKVPGGNLNPRSVRQINNVEVQHNRASWHPLPNRFGRACMKRLGPSRQGQQQHEETLSSTRTNQTVLHT